MALVNAPVQLRGARVRLPLQHRQRRASSTPYRDVQPHSRRPGASYAIHRSAWKWNSAKFVFRILHSPIPIQAEKFRFPGRAPNRKPYMLWRCIKMQQGECEAACSERRCGAGCSSHLRRTCDGKTALPGKSPTVSEISNPDYSGTIWRASVRSRKDRLKQIHQHPLHSKVGCRGGVSKTTVLEP